MAILRELGTARDSWLGSRHLVGRSAICQLRIDEPSVSGIHAELTWKGASWEARDLGSRNGTHLDGHKLAPGERVRLGEGAVLCFGVSERRYVLVDDSAPQLVAISAQGERVLGEHGLLHLPDAETCAASVFYSSAENRWILETDSDRSEIEDQGVMVVADQRWRVILPAEIDDTRDASARRRVFGDLHFEFSVSRDNEHVSLKVRDGHDTWDLEDRAHVDLLLELARARIADQGQAHLSAGDHGWVYRDDLLKALAIDAQLLNLWVHRARQQLAELDIIGVGDLVERRSRVQQLRIGSPHLSLVTA